MKKIFIAFLISVFLSPVGMYANPFPLTIIGLVQDTNNTPLQNITVEEFTINDRSTGTSTQTDADGKWAMTMSTLDNTLVIGATSDYNEWRGTGNDLVQNGDYELDGKARIYKTTLTKKQNAPDNSSGGPTQQSEKQITISGTVTDQNGEPLPGVNIRTQNDDTKGTSTDINGTFTLNNVPHNARILFSYVGFLGHECVANECGQNIVLQENAKTLQDAEIIAQRPNTTISTPNNLTIDTTGAATIPADKVKLAELDTSTTPTTQDEPAAEEPAEEPAAEEQKPEPVKPRLSLEQYRQEISELKKNATAMHDRENSLANRMIGAVGIGATGIGGTMVGAALSERAADDDAEREMRAYLETFRCDYGAGTTVRGGETNVELPGGNDMIGLYTEYAQLANDLKIRKTALGIRPGIESDIVIDKAETGLYDDVGTGISGGAYASIARALLDPNGEDAKRWAAQRDSTNSKLTTGAIVAGVGAVGSAVANIAVNHGTGDKSSEILKKYSVMRAPFEQLEQRVNNTQPTQSCSQYNATGTYPNCTCNNANSYFTTNGGCVECSGDLVVNTNGDGCVCPSTKPVQSGTSCAATTQNCSLRGLTATNACRCVDNATANNDKCECQNGYGEENGQCVKQQQQQQTESPQQQLQTGNTIVQVNMGSDVLFESGSATLTPEGKSTLTEFVSGCQSTAKQHGIDLTNATDYCLIIVGKTDHQGFSPRNPFYSRAGNDAERNIALSLARAESAKEEITSAFNESNIRTYGIGASDCATSTPKNQPDCRRVNIIMVAGPCDTNLTNTSSWINNVAGAGTGTDALITAINNN